VVSNSKLYANVMAKLRFEPGLDSSNIAVSIINDNNVDNIVMLGGKVQSYAEKHIAEEAVEKIKKVRGVANEIEVDVSLKYKRSDVDIAKAAINALRWTVLVPREKIKVAIENGCLTLVGEVNDLYQKARAHDAVKNLFGVLTIINEIKVITNVKPTAVKETIIKEFERNARIDANNIQVEVEGTKIILKGGVKNFDEYKEAKNAALSISGITEVEVDDLKIS
jgi:osmotically-inducible protein OsmY